MADSVLTVLLLLAAGAAAYLAHRTARHWRGEQAGRAYELPVDHRGTALRAGAAALAGVAATTLAVSLLYGGGSPAGPARPVAAASLVPAAPSLPPPPVRRPEPAPPQPAARTIGRPAGGTLQLLRDGTRVWLPPLYDSARAAGIAYPVVVTRVAGEDADLYSGFARAAQRKRADLFVLVMPAECGRDSAAVLAEVAHRYRTLTTRSARGLLGIGGEATCAVREALASEGRYGAAAGVSGTYPALTPAAGRHPTLLLASANGESGPRASALRLKAALRATLPHGDSVRELDGMGGPGDVFALVAGFMTEKLDGPARTASPPSPGGTARGR